jgi:hypothetical protein
MGSIGQTPHALLAQLKVAKINWEFLRGSKGALRIPSLSFQYLRRPGRTAKLLCFHTAGGFESHRLHQICKKSLFVTPSSFAFPLELSSAILIDDYFVFT